MAQIILFCCRDANVRVMRILNEISKKEDVTEFVTTIQLVQITINGLLKSEREFKFDALKDLQDALKEYETLLTQLNGTGTLLRFVASSRLRKKIEQANANIHEKLNIFKQSIDKDAPAPPNNNSSQQNVTIGSRASTQIDNDQRSNNNNAQANEKPQMEEDEVEGNVMLSVMIEDQDGQAAWAELFGLNNFTVPWKTFIGGLRKIIADINENDEIVLQWILDQAGTRLVNQHKFSEFLKGFGPVSDCVKNVKNIVSAPWFYGFLSRKEADLLLRDQPVGRFLIRFSATAPGSFALAFATANSNNYKTTCHILINSCKPVGFQIQEEDKARTFQNLYEIVDYYSVFLQTPYDQVIPYEDWFEGELTGKEANELLSGQKPGSFLVRFSSIAGSYAISFVNEMNGISHSLVEHEGVPDNGYKIENEGQSYIFSNLPDVVNHYSEALKFPQKASTTPSYLRGSKIVLKWREERSQTMQQLAKVVDQLFDPYKPMPALPSNLNLSSSHGTLQRRLSQGSGQPSQELEQKVNSILERLFGN